MAGIRFMPDSRTTKLTTNTYLIENGKTVIS